MNAILSLDISTTTTGICLIEENTGKLLKLDHISLNTKKTGKLLYPDFWSKVDCVERFLDIFCQSYKICAIGVEESAKRFTPGLSSADTLFTLAKFNAVICYILYKKYSLKPTEINVRSARKSIGISIDYKNTSKNTKQKVLEQVFKRNPEFPWIYHNVKGKQILNKINEDRADAWVIGEATRILHLIKTRQVKQ